ncbi:MFS transporter [Ottowia thiooxydans]|uniref:DHA1 family tetracycline resistance protein-like MFS transporter n=1 Tax=Ottowia thiooxydans TaxID=219182 RepID=A0ABV2QBI7_9BURK
MSTCSEQSSQSVSRSGAPVIGALMFENFACTLAVMSFVGLLGPVAQGLGLAPWQVGLAATIGGLTWVVLARPWGAASDRLGRRPILLQGLAGFALSHFLMCLFVVLALKYSLPVWASFLGLLILRGAAGAFYAAVPTTGAALIADLVPPMNRAGTLGKLGAAGAVGMVLGPGLAGILASYSLTLPLMITTVLPLLSLAVLWRWLPSAAPSSDSNTTPLKMTDQRLRGPMTVAFIAIFSLTVSQIVAGFFALDRLGLDPASGAKTAGVSLTLSGLAMILAQMSVRRLGWSSMRLIALGGLLAAGGFLSVLLADTAIALWAGYFVAALGLGWMLPAAAAQAANAVSPVEQGSAAGTIGAASGLAIMAAPFIGTVAYDIDPRAPYALIAALLCTGIWLGRSRS